MARLVLPVLGLWAVAPGWAAGETADERVCRRGPDVRVVELRRERTGTSENCAVHYRKETEIPGHEEVLWRATGNPAFCRGKADRLVGRLTEWGWRCDSPLPQAAWPTTLAATVDTYLSEIRARYESAYAGGRTRVGRGRLALGDLDGDGIDDAVVQVTIDTVPAGLRASIAVFVADGAGGYRHLATRSLGGAARWPTRVSIREGRIVLRTESFADAGTTGNGHSVYEVVGTRLVKVAAD